MPAEPTFLMDVEIDSDPSDFQSYPANRRGEGIVWLSVVIVGAVVFYVFQRTQSSSLLAILFFGFVLTLAILTSYGNWVNNNTRVRISPSYVLYQTPLRKVQLPPEEIESLSVVPAGRGWRIFVKGRGKGFSYQTLTHVHLTANREVRFGLQGGTRLAGLIRQRAELGPPVMGDGFWTCHRSGGTDDDSP